MGEKQQVSLEDVARYCGLSTVTVSRVLNHSPSVREYNRKKVMEAMEALTTYPMRRRGHWPGEPQGLSV